MCTRFAMPSLVSIVLCSASMFGQNAPAATAHVGAEEFPVALQEKVAAGKTPVGTKIQAKLEVPTLVNGTVLPRNAVFSGEVIASEAKTATSPSRMEIRVDSVEWKDGSAPITAYLTAWYYQVPMMPEQSLQYGPPQPSNKTWNGMGQYPDPNSPAYREFPSSDRTQDSSAGKPTSSNPSRRLAQMENVEPELNPDGGVVLVSKKGNIKLDKVTTYILATRAPAH